ncbi:GNAT family N-acetyltransferase [Pedococcus sp. NPDC057267]|uniref:GNAT family N-acetyltransferase n=1 Tax=Pedococcus sp. NPDC057267 TaxID=3346077 RepID=UPI00363F8976
MGTAIQRSTVADLPSLLPLLRGYSTFYRTPARDEDLLRMAEAFCGDSPDGLQLLARTEDGTLVGYATVLWSWDTTSGTRLAVMEDLFVTEAVRGEGVGRALLEACASTARERGCTALAWETAPDNDVAQRLYDATGAERSTWLGYRLALG